MENAEEICKPMRRELCMQAASPTLQRRVGLAMLDRASVGSNVRLQPTKHDLPGRVSTAELQRERIEKAS